MNERILIIEDDQAILKLLQRGLAYEGYTVDTAVDGRMGLIAARDHTPDTIRPLLTASEVPECRLIDRVSYAPRLGWTTWLKTKPFANDADQVIFSGHFRTTSAAAV